MKQVKGEFASGKKTDYKEKYDKKHLLYVCKIRNRKTGELLGKIGHSHYNTLYRFSSDLNYEVIETYEFYFPNGVLSAGVESIVSHQYTRLYRVEPQAYLKGRDEVFDVTELQNVVEQVIKCRKELNLEFNEYPALVRDYDYIKHAYEEDQEEEEEHNEDDNYYGI